MGVQPEKFRQVTNWTHAIATKTYGRCKSKKSYWATSHLLEFETAVWWFRKDVEYTV